MTKWAYYNDNDPYVCEWVKNLITAGHIANGIVDCRPIQEVKADDLREFTQVHMFCGIGGWSYALRLAGWPDDRPVWTGSCPCQPFSSAGKGAAADDERHLWPAWFPLIAERRPAIIFGEQVEAAIGWGWLDAVFADLEGEGYACGATVLPACGVGAPHIRQRCWFVADADNQRGGIRNADRQTKRDERGGQEARGAGIVLQRSGLSGDMAVPASPRRSVQPQRPAGEDGRAAPEPRRLCDAGGMGNAESRDGGLPNGSIRQQVPEPARASQAGDLGDSSIKGLPPHQRSIIRGQRGGYEGRATEQPSRSPWADLEWLPCTDGKSRPTKPGLFPLAHGVPGRVGKLRAAGNAIVPQCAQAFIEAYMIVESTNPSEGRRG